MDPWGWMELAEAAPGTLQTVARDTTVDSARRKSITIAHAMRAVAGAATAAEQSNILSAFPSPSADLDNAIDELYHLIALQLSAGLAYDLYLGRLVLDGRGRGGHDRRPDALLLQTWRGHGHNTLFHAWDAIKKLRFAAAIAGGAVDAMYPELADWASRAARRSDNAAVATALALNALRRMRDAAAREFRVASTRVLNS